MAVRMAFAETARATPTLGAGLERERSIWERMHIDVPLLFALVVVLCFGMLVLYSAVDGSPDELRRQGVFIGLGFVVMLVMAQVDVRLLRKLSPWMFLGGTFLLVLVLIMGDVAKGAQRWLDLPGLPRFQPSEIMKTVVPLTVATWLSGRVLPPRFHHVLVALCLLGVPTVLTQQQPDLGTSVLIATSGLFVILLAGINWKLVFGAMIVGLSAIPPMWLFVLEEYQKKRVLTLINPQIDPLGAGWNIIQSQTAIGSGGIYGKGWLNGVQSRLDFLPEGQTDFILAVLAEEFGLMGVLFLLGLYIVIIGRGLYIAATAQDMFDRLLAGSLSLTFFVYVFVNIGMVSGILPVVGVPLPLVSLGGTSIVSLMLGFGILMSIHTHRVQRLGY
jgi:rod shape determining protein RodA